MSVTVIKVRLPLDLHKRYKRICFDKELSMSKQTAEFIRHFVELREEEEKRLQK